MANRNYIQAQKFTLKTSISLSATSIELTTFNLPDGTAIVSGDLGNINHATIAPGTANEEVITFTGLSGTTLTGVTRGIRFDSPYTQDTGLRKAQSAGTVLVITNTAAWYNDFVNKGNEETITGALFVPAPTADTHVATKKYVDDTTNGGVVSHDQVITAGNAGETVSAGQAIFFNPTDNEWRLADASVVATTDKILLGFAQGAGTNGNAIAGGVLLSGLEKNQSGLTIGDEQFLSDTAGAISTSAGTIERALGFARTTTEIYFDPNYNDHTTALQQAAMAGDGGTPSSTNKFQTERSSRFGFRTLTAGATINGATLPVPVFQNDSDNEFYACDANDTSAMKYLGFAISNGTDGNDIDVQFTGIVTGFSGLDEGEKYYVQDAVGTIGNTIGTQEILVGVAISQTEIMIQKGRRHAAGTVTSGLGTSSSSVIVNGFRPSIVRITVMGLDTNAAQHSILQFTHTNGGLNGLNMLNDGAANSLDFNITLRENASDEITFTITSVTDTGFTITWVSDNIGTMDDIGLLWEAEGEL